ncbi:MAG: hypothetical protein EXS68_01685 [Candidatus Ryanbacteria bacterium]|nr:hypothetical protein [Candidatus Ryanbacteria bacterium]
MYSRIKQLTIVFVAAFLLNLAWENVHSYLYMHYQGGSITELILIKAAFFDAFATLIAAALYLWVKPFRGRLDVTLGSLFVFAIGLELFALATLRWHYSSWMPILPCLDVGITPIIQLALLAYISFRFAGLPKKEKTR